jgi:hypothetical protein
VRRSNPVALWSSFHLTRGTVRYIYLAHHQEANCRKTKKRLTYQEHTKYTCYVCLVQYRHINSKMIYSQRRWSWQNVEILMVRHKITHCGNLGSSPCKQQYVHYNVLYFLQFMFFEFFWQDLLYLRFNKSSGVNFGRLWVRTALSTITKSSYSEVKGLRKNFHQS